MRTITQFVEDLLRSRRPRGFCADAEDASLARTAITLRAARPGSGTAREEFVTALRKRLAAELSPALQQTGSGRRSFIRAATVAAGAAVAGAGIDHALAGRPAAPASPQSTGTLIPASGTWRTVMPSADLPEGAVHSFTVGGVTGFVERTSGRLRAVSGICTHQGCRLVIAHKARLACPCHGATFALDGTVTWHRPGITLTALPGLAVRETGGMIQVCAPRLP